MFKKISRKVLKFANGLAADYYSKGQKRTPKKK